MRTPRAWLRRVAGVGVLLAIGGVGTGLVAAIDNLPDQPLFEGDPIASPSAALFAAMPPELITKFGRPASIGTSRFVNDPIANGRAR